MSCFFYDAAVATEVLVEGKNSRKIRAYGGKIMIVEAIFENGGIGELHSHPHEQVTYCLNGEFEFTVGDQTSVVKEGDSLYIPPDIMHGCVLKSGSGRVLDVFTPIREDFLIKNNFLDKEGSDQ